MEATRRALLRGAVGGALAAGGLGAGAAARAEKVDICHYDADTGTYHHINVSRNARDAHLAHGDFGGCVPPFDVDFTSGRCICAMNCKEGHELSLDTCECVPVPSIETVTIGENECTGQAIGDSCGRGSGGTDSSDSYRERCAALWSDRDTMLCVDDLVVEGSVQDFTYACSTECSAGEVCVHYAYTDEHGESLGHCHPPVTS